MSAEYTQLSRRRGRPLGSPGKVDKAAGELVLKVFRLLGDAEGMAKWAESSPANMYAFYVHIFPRLIKNNAAASISVNNGGTTLELNSVVVADPRAALTTLERLQDADDAAYWASREGGDGRQVAAALSTHEVDLQAPDGGDAGSEEAEGDPDAAAPRQDDGVRSGAPVSLLCDVPVA